MTKKEPTEYGTINVQQRLDPRLSAAQASGGVGQHRGKETGKPILVHWH
jgi:hypothetical protein